MGASVGASTRLALAQDAVVALLKTLSPRDRVAVIAFSSGISSAPGCYGSQLAATIPVNIAALTSFVYGLAPGGGAVYSAALQTALAMLSDARDSGTSDRTQVVLFVTDGDPTDSSTSIMNVLDTANANRTARVFTYGVGLSTSPLLQAIASQNRGAFYPVPNAADIRTQLGTYYIALSAHSNGTQSPVWTVPYFDASGLGVVTTATLPVYHDAVFMGVAGVDTVLSDLLSDLGRYSLDKSYAFIVDDGGRVLVHPALPALLDVQDAPQYFDVAQLEVEPEFGVVKAAMLARQSGAHTYNKTFVKARGNSLLRGVVTTVESTTVHYRPVAGTPFSVALVLASSDAGAVAAVAGHVPTPTSLPVYHELRTLGREQCQAYSAPVITLAATYKFAPSAFADPTSFVNGRFSRADLARFQQYITGALSASQVRAQFSIEPCLGHRMLGVCLQVPRGLRLLDLNATSADLWKAASVLSLWAHDYCYAPNTNVIRKLLGTKAGTFLKFPGGESARTYDP